MGKAARGEDARTYPWGNDSIDSSRANLCDATCRADEREPSLNDGYPETAPVGSYPAGASPYGLLDMAGNALEWVYDWYSSDTYQVGPRLNPGGPAQGLYQLVRGGSWASPAGYLRVTYRQARAPLTAWPDVGFRCVQADLRSQLIFPGQPTETLIPTETPEPSPVPTATAYPGFWALAYGGADTYQLRTIRTTSDGGYILAGAATAQDHLWIAKADRDGSLTWLCSAYP
jgi:hypothetical protein